MSSTRLRRNSWRPAQRPFAQPIDGHIEAVEAALHRLEATLERVVVDDRHEIVVAPGGLIPRLILGKVVRKGPSGEGHQAELAVNEENWEKIIKDYNLNDLSI